MMLPKVLIGGFPNSGTSFLCNLVAEMGFSPGSHKNLKPADEHNRWGYWEHLPIRKLAWRAAFGKRLPRPELLSFWHDYNHPTRPNWKSMSKIRQTAIADGVEVYKDCLLPILFTLFAQDARYLIIERNHKEIFRSGSYQQTCKGHLTLDNFYRSYKDYTRMVRQMSKRVNCLTVEYRDFKVDFEGTVSQIAVHLDVTVLNMKKLHKVFRPRT